MSIQNIHPKYSKFLSKWDKCIDNYDGSDAIKDKRTTYLPYTHGQKEDGAEANVCTDGGQDYDAYLLRAYFPEIYSDAVEHAVGIMHKKKPSIQLTPKLEEMMEKATLANEGLEDVLREINTAQIKTGRIGIMGDIRNDSDGFPKPVIVLYDEKSIRNWDDTSEDDKDSSFRMLVLDESRYEMDINLTWEFKNKYRFCGLINDEGFDAKNGVYVTKIYDEGDDVSFDTANAPHWHGQTFNKIPFAVVNAKDINPSPDKPPLIGLADLCLAIYRGEADYRQNLHMQSQDTLVEIGGDSDTATRIGAGAKITIPDTDGDAKFIGVGAEGLSEQRTSLENDYKRAGEKAGQLMSGSAGPNSESGDSLRVRVSSLTANFPTIAKAGALGLQTVLRNLAEWAGDNPDDIIVEPHLEFTEKELDGQKLTSLIQAKSLGAPISERTIHNYVRENGVTELSYEDEIEELANEEPRP